ncbi:hypothetical protein GGI04_000798 [Coemansia thaxteri]|uniref:Cyclin N-terminal domain-containing protein n=1 Tax=Coemansia thaxteri TaxID=2663907 RepID=A0A9W8BLI8_9FUNG|nr:hypothetical protein H4R26_001638 [Coemansia thaxteri]KAJ2008993.1 hypothetical protein GGI04_000798 [Coemansia thaxteri]KAJ2470048.1 hypothetical protein GGI02_003185 [Coemansia sp. RSA 2322]KAJ2481592.1 hypothetical protein EV174_003428 [Coemansia sp. RSA 2320]
MSTALATPGPRVDLGPTAAGGTSQSSQLMRTTARSLKSLMRTSDRAPQQHAVGVSSLRSNFAHIILQPPLLPAIESFICSVTASLKIKVGVLVTALIYVERLRKQLPKSATGSADTPYRIFLASLLLADKFWSDHSVQIKSLVAAAGAVFSKREIAAMERALLKLLRFNLYVSADEIRTHAQRLGMCIDEHTAAVCAP